VRRLHPPAVLGGRERLGVDAAHQGLAHPVVVERRLLVVEVEPLGAVSGSVVDGQVRVLRPAQQLGVVATEDQVDVTVLQ
jgi:hypothetical protein